MLERYFRLKENKTDVRTEVIAGLATFMTMAYIIFVNPIILKDAGVPQAGAIFATALGAGIMTLAMGIFTNYPFALASGMGLNAFLTYSVVIGLKLPWQAAMGMVVIEGLLVTILVLTRVREAIMEAIPVALKRAIGVGIGLFIAFIGLQGAGFVVSSQATLVTFGGLSNPGAVVSMFGVFVTAIMISHRVKGSILLGIVLSTILAIFLQLAKLPTQIASMPTAESFATLFQFDLRALYQPALWAVIFSFLITDFFDTMGTVVAIGGEAGFMDKKGHIPRLRNILLVDSLAAVIGGAFGASSITTYIESAAGVSEGGRTGLTSVVTAVLFFLAIFFAPIIGIVPTAAVAPALIIVGFLMMTVVKDIPFDRFDDAFPAFLTIITIPLTYSIARGIGYGFIAYAVVKLFTGKTRDVHPLMWVAALLFAVSFVI